MVSRLFVGYVVIELVVVVALASSIGLGWTLLSLLAAFVVGVALAGSQVKRQLARSRFGLTTPERRARLLFGPPNGPHRRQAGEAVTDGTLVALGTMLVIVPGLVTSAAGVLLLLPPTRAAARPVLAAMAARRIGLPLITVATIGDRHGAGRRPEDDVIDGEVIDGEVIDVTDVEPPALPPRTA